MAAAAFTINLGSGFKNQHGQWYIRQRNGMWSSPGVLNFNASERSSQVFFDAQNLFNRNTRHLEMKKHGHYQLPFSKSTTSCSNNSHERENEESVSKATLIWRSIKLPIYSVAFVPLTVGGAVAYLQTGVFLASRYFVLLASSILIITWLNLSNDVYDSETGADRNKKESVVNLVGSHSGAFIAACSSLALGSIGLIWTSAVAGNLRAMLLLASAIVCGYIYQCPPFRLSYQGLGEPLCFAAFGPFATTAFYLLLSNTSEMSNLPSSGTVLSASLLVGFTTTLILFCSHFHQVEEDRAVGKMSPLVRLGVEKGSTVVKLAVVTVYSLLFTFALAGTLPFTCILLCALTLPMGNLLVSFVEENHKDKGKIFTAKYYCVRLHTLFGAALAAGFVAARIPRLLFP